ncbi:MAG: hypothetical protein BMS9Abin08_1178 [Gammaproteobacteria bacterium]|nr:MAG: hypothetical protein BMS9Abin08_1178 [Gammaproteobacteria bacterium]
MEFTRSAVVLCCVFGMVTANAASPFDDEGLYGEEGAPAYHDPLKVTEPEGHEQDVSLPPWPVEENLIPVDLSLPNFPYRLFIDGKSLSVDADKVIRYTVVLRSLSGAENVTYEGVLCNHMQLQRYAYGSRGQFRRVRKPGWRYTRKQGQDRYRRELMRYFFCPLPDGDSAGQILAKLKTRNFGQFQFSDKLPE